MMVINVSTNKPLHRRVGELALGSVVINGEGNLCLVARSDKVDKVRLVNLHNGGTYLVNESCRHEEVHAELHWRHREVV